MVDAVSLVRSSRLQEPNSATETKRPSLQTFDLALGLLALGLSIRDMIECLGYGHHSYE
ncbi:MAG: hypothetical protein ACK480_11825 [Planctomycetota bacterium]|jgi:hypothetical protein